MSETPKLDPHDLVLSCRWAAVCHPIQTTLSMARTAAEKPFGQQPLEITTRLDLLYRRPSDSEPTPVRRPSSVCSTSPAQCSATAPASGGTAPRPPLLEQRDAASTGRPVTLCSSPKGVKEDTRTPLARMVGSPFTRSRRTDVLQRSQISTRATGWVDQAPSHAATPSSWLMH